MGKDFLDFITLDSQYAIPDSQGVIDKIDYKKVFNNIPVLITIWELKGDDFLFLHSNNTLDKKIREKLSVGVLLSKTFPQAYRNIFSPNESSPVDSSSIQIMLNHNLLLIYHNGSQHIINQDIDQYDYNRESFKTIIEQSPVSIIITDILGNIEYINPKFIEVTGYTSDEIIGKSPRVLKSGSTSSEEYKKLWDTILSGKVWKGEFINKRKNGDLYYEYAVIAPIKNINGAINNFIAIKEDITQLKETDKELRKSEKFAALGKMAAYVSHEIKSPLTSIKMNIDLLSLSSGIPETQKKSIHIIQKEIKRLDKLLQDISSFTREKELELVDLELSGLINSTAEVLYPLIASKGISVVNKVDKIRILGDSQKLQTVFMHLLENSIDAVPIEGRIEFTSELDVKKENLFIYLRDDGHGICKNINPFEPFITTKYSGTGLGLPIVNKIMCKHLGSVEIVSAEPGSTVFRLRFPLNINIYGKNISN